MNENIDKNVFQASWTYDEAPESTDHIQIKKQYELFIDGEFILPVKKQYFDTLDPSTNKKIAQVAEASSEDVDKAVKAARKAYKGWSG